MEKRAAHLLNVLHDGRLKIPEAPGRESLVLIAAHTRLPEASVLRMPSVAQAEIALGLSGELRHRIASAPEDEPTLEALRDELLAEVGSWCNTDSAVEICDAIHAGRALRREIPVIVGADLLRWYHHYRRPNDAQHETALEETATTGRSVIGTLEERYDAWIAEPARRDGIELELYDLLATHFGDAPRGAAARDELIDRDL